MDRRSFLAVAAGGSLAGCSGDGGVTVSTPTATATATPDPLTPDIQAVALVSDWKEFGDVEENRIQSITPDEYATVAARFNPICNEDREVRWRHRVAIYDSSGDAIASESTDNDEFTNSCGDGRRTVEWEQAVSLGYDNDYSTEWPVGEYEAEVSIDDYYSGVSATESTTFEVVDSE